MSGTRYAVMIKSMRRIDNGFVFLVASYDPRIKVYYNYDSKNTFTVDLKRTPDKILKTAQAKFTGLEQRPDGTFDPAAIEKMFKTIGFDLFKHYGYVDTRPTVDKKSFLHYLDIWGDGLHITWERKDDVSVKELYNLLCLQYGLAPSTFTKYFGDFNIIGEEKNDNSVLNQFSFNDWNVTTESKLPKSIDEIKTLLSEVDSILHKNSIDGVSYGQISFVKKMPTNRILAWYRNDDTILCSLKEPGSNTMLSTLLHEIGHRFYGKKISNDARRELYDKFSDIKQGNRNLSEGDMIKVAGGTVLQIVKRTYKHGKPAYDSIIIESDEKKKYDVGAKVTFTPGGKYTLLNKEQPINDFIPTSYSMKSEEEYFCEMFSYYLLDKLHPRAAEWFKQLLK